MRYLGHYITTRDHLMTGLVTKENEKQGLLLVRFWDHGIREYQETLVRTQNAFRRNPERRMNEVNKDDPAYWSDLYDIGIDLSLVSKDAIWFKEITDAARLTKYF